MAKKTSPTEKSSRKKQQDAAAEKGERKSPRKSVGATPTSKRNSLEGLDIETDDSGSEGQEGEVYLAYHSDEDGGKEEASGNSAQQQAAKKKAPVFKSKSFFKLNNNLMLSGKISGKNLISSGLSGKLGKSGKSSAVNNQWEGPNANPIEEAQRNSSIYDPTVSAASPLMPAKTKKEKTLGKGWFDMKPASLDASMKGDLKMVEMRNYLDPKRFYKNPDKIKKVLHVGTVVEGAAEYTTNRMTKKERKQSLVGEIIADKQIKDYTKRKYVELQHEKEAKSGRKKKSKKPGQRDGVGSGSKKIRKLF